MNILSLDLIRAGIYIEKQMIEKLENEIAEAFPEGLTRQKMIPTFHPESPEEAVDIFNRATSYNQKLFISGFGNNIDPIGSDFGELLVIKTDRLNSIVEVSAEDFHLTVGAGYPLKEINRIISEMGLYFPFGATNYPGSFGGAVAAGLTGFDGEQIVPISRNLLSVTAVLPDGSLVRPGAKTFKSVSGYDISRIFFNSWGTLGILFDLTFRVLPLSKKKEQPHIAPDHPNYRAFLNELQGENGLSAMCRKIKSEYDPKNLLGPF